MADVLDLHDSEVRQLIQLQMELNERAKAKRHNYPDFEREIRDRFAKLGFTVEVSWYEFEAAGQRQDGAMPEVTITGRTDDRFQFDPDRQVHEAVHNVLEIPGEDGWIKADPDTLKTFLDGNGAMAMATLTDQMTQKAPYPEILASLVDRLEYRPGWEFMLTHTDRGQGSTGLTLIITTLGYNSYHPERGESYRVNHYMLVPPAAYNQASWRMWLFDQLLLVEKHEAMEFFALHDFPGSEHKVRPYAPNHGFGWDPYLVTEVTTGEDRRTNFRNEPVPGS